MGMNQYDKILQRESEEYNSSKGHYYEVPVNPWDTAQDIMDKLKEQALHGKRKKMTEKDFLPGRKVTREEVYNECIQKIALTNSLLLELPTGYGKSKLSIDLTNYLINSQWYKESKTINILILVAKRVHKQTWADEIKKWGGINHPTAEINICMECYESLKNHCQERWDICIADETHHVASEMRLKRLKTMSFGYFIGLSATIPQKLKMWFKYNYHSEVVSCDITQAIDSEVLPEPTILLFPLEVENTRQSETIEFHADAKGPIVYGTIRDYWRLKKQKKTHAIIRCTQKQKLTVINRDIDYYKSMGKEKTWLYLCGKRLEFLADCKLQWVKLILHHLDKERTITFCKTIAQTEQLGKNCIHSQNKDAAKIYEQFNAGKIDHITAVNILNENANLVNCKYAVFCNLSSSDIVVYQRLGRSLRHKEPVIIMPYYKGTREEELIAKLVVGDGWKETMGMTGIKNVTGLLSSTKNYLFKTKVIHSINEI